MLLNLNQLKFSIKNLKKLKNKIDVTKFFYFAYLNNYFNYIYLNNLNEIIILIKNNKINIQSIFFFLKNNLNFQFKLLMDMICVDNLLLKKNLNCIYKNNFYDNYKLKVKKKIIFIYYYINNYSKNFERFSITYCLLSIKYNYRLKIKIPINNLNSIISITSIYSSANWLEREIWDLYGIYFFYHLDLRRILTDYGFEGHALRKDFPLIGFLEVRYDDEKKKIVYEPVEMTQEMRVFNFLSPWSIITKI